MGLNIAIRFFFFLSLSCLFLEGCASIYRFPEVITGADEWEDVRDIHPFTRLERELGAIAETERIAAQELVVRLPAANLFRVGEYNLQAGAEHNLKALAQILSGRPQLLVIVEGHTDTVGSESYNQWLSERRSRVIADFLVNSGMDPNTIQVVGYGESYPLTSGNTPEAGQQNRRIQLRITPLQF